MGNEIITKTIKRIDLKSCTDYTAHKVGKAEWNDEKEELEITLNEFRGKGWRLVHDGVEVLGFFEADGVTGSIWTLFVGTEAECQNQIEQLGLLNEETKDQINKET